MDHLKIYPSDTAGLSSVDEIISIATVLFISIKMARQEFVIFMKI